MSARSARTVAEAVLEQFEKLEQVSLREAHAETLLRLFTKELEAARLRGVRASAKLCREYARTGGVQGRDSWRSPNKHLGPRHTAEEHLERNVGSFLAREIERKERQR